MTHLSTAIIYKYITKSDVKQTIHLLIACVALILPRPRRRRLPRWRQGEDGCVKEVKLVIGYNVSFINTIKIRENHRIENVPDFHLIALVTLSQYSF